MKDNSQGGSLQEGLSEKQSLNKEYTPRSEGQGQRPGPSTKEKAGKFKIC